MNAPKKLIVASGAAAKAIAHRMLRNANVTAEATPVPNGLFSPWQLPPLVAVQNSNPVVPLPNGYSSQCCSEPWCPTEMRSKFRVRFRIDAEALAANVAASEF